MRKYAKPLLIIAAMAASASALAVQKDITINANVDTQLDMTQADNSPLPSSINMQYLPGQGLDSYRLNTKIWSNSATSNVKIRLLGQAYLTNLDNDENTALVIKLGGKKLGVTDTEFMPLDLFPGGIDNGSSVQPLTISQEVKGPLETGRYSGIISLVLTQGTTTEEAGK